MKSPNITIQRKKTKYTGNIQICQIKMSEHSENYGNHWETQMNINTDLKDCQTDKKYHHAGYRGEEQRRWAVI